MNHHDILDLMASDAILLATAGGYKKEDHRFRIEINDKLGMMISIHTRELVTKVESVAYVNSVALFKVTVDNDEITYTQNTLTQTCVDGTNLPVEELTQIYDSIKSIDIFDHLTYTGHMLKTTSDIITSVKNQLGWLEQRVLDKLAELNIRFDSGETQAISVECPTNHPIQKWLYDDSAIIRNPDALARELAWALK